MKPCASIACVVLLVCSAHTRAAAVSLPLARDGKALVPIVVSAPASARVKGAAATLASYLGRIAGCTFEVVSDANAKGIRVGLASEFADRDLGIKWASPNSSQRENYLIRTHAAGAYLIGATELAVEHAAWDLLHRIGYRQYFPGAHWEVIPRIANLSVAVDVDESPDYHSRRIWYGYGPWDYAAKPYADWCAKNRATSGIVLNSGHAYPGIVRANQAQFDAHPEYFALVNGKRNPNTQLCLSNTDLRQLIVAHALRHFAAEPLADSISMDPNDGGGWCECAHCQKLGSVTDRVLTLANEVAEAVNKKFDDKRVGMYAYAYHSPPPSIRVHPKVVISVATAFIKGGLTLDELIAGWSKQGATLGIREYYSVHTWDRDMPAGARGGNLAYLARTIPEFHAKGARFMSAESSDNWGPNGLGYYLAARMLWDVDEAKNTDDIVEDFLTRAFGPAKEPMRRFYQQIESGKPHLVFDDQLGQMFRCLQDAKSRADSPEIVARIDDLLLYARYVDLFDRYTHARGAERQAAFEAVIRHGYRMRTTMLIHTKALYRDVDSRDKSIQIPPDAGWSIPEAKNPWKSSTPFTSAELQSYLDEGIKTRPLVQIDFALKSSYGGILMPARSLKLPGVKPADFPRGRGTQTFYTWFDRPNHTLELKLTGGLIAHYRDRGNVWVKLWRLADDNLETLVAEDRSVPPDGVERTVSLRAKERGLHKITVSDGGDMTRVAWTEGTPIAFKSSLEEPLKTTGRWSLCFYVPKGTSVIGLFGGETGDIVDPAGKKAFTLNGKKTSFYGVAVAAGQDGKLWRIQSAAGPVRLVNIPPYLARSAEELLLPDELVERDRPR